MPASSASFGVWTAGLTVLIAAGCATAPAQLELAYTPPAGVARKAAPPETAGERVCFLPVAEGRGNGDEAGEIGGRTITIPHALVWCQSALHTLDTPAVRSVPKAGIPEGSEILAAPHLRKLHLESVLASKSATIVLEVEYRLSGQRSLRRVYRGREVAINWSSSAGEAESAFNVAMDHCLALIRDDLAHGLSVIASQSNGG